MTLEWDQQKQIEVLEQIARELTALQPLAAKTGEDFLAFLIAQAQDEAEVVAATRSYKRRSG